MGGVVDFGKDLIGSITGSGSEKASKQAAQTSADAQLQALEYLKERERMPQEMREGALGVLGGLYGIGDTSGAASTLQNSPLYQATVGQLPQQEEAILRSQSATGALRSSGTEQMLAQNQQQNQLQAYQNALQPLQGLAGLGSNSSQIAQGIAGVGQTLAQGQIAGAQARQQGISNTIGLGMNALSLMGFSDVRLKDDIKPAGTRYGQDWFTWTWNEKANDLGLHGEDQGVIADLVKSTRPDLVGESNGYLTVNYLELANG